MRTCKLAISMGCCAFVIALCVTVLPSTTVAAEPAQARNTTYNLDIPAQRLSDALQALALATKHKLLYSSELVDGKSSPALKGVFTTEQAVKALLAGTNLSCNVTADGLVLVRAADPPSSTLAAPRTPSESRGSPIRVTQVNQGITSITSASGNNSPNSPNDESGSSALAEIIVSAQKRPEKLMDVPSSMSAISGERLEALQINTLTDLASYVPGLSITDGGAPGSRLIEIRGLSTGYYPTTGSLVGTYIDDLPLGDSTSNARGALFGLDLNPYDIDHVEVLKGPQGTLYGANTMAGLVKYVLRQPDLQEFQASAGVDGGYIEGGDRPNWGVRGAINLPIVTGAIALRLSGFDKYTAGYIDDVLTGTKDINYSTETGGRASLLWQITDGLSIRAVVLAQNVNATNIAAVTLNGTTLQPLDGPFTVSSYFQQPDTQQSRLYSLSLDWKFNFATLTNSTGWSRISSYQVNDNTASFAPLVPGNPDALVPFILFLRASKFVDELRLTSPEKQRIQWMLGGYFTHEDAYQVQNAPPFTPSYVPLPPADQVFYLLSTGDYKEYAEFANITYKINERLDVSAGERFSEYINTSCPVTGGGVLVVGVQFECSSLPTTGVFVWMGNARFHLNEDALLYARVSTGYRPGSGCPTCGNPSLGIPGIVNSDKTTNYEVGFKSLLFEKRLQLELSAFHIDWTDIQLTQVGRFGIIYPGNGGTAVSNGVEATAAYRPMEGLSVNATLAYTDAHLTQNAPGAGGESGDQLTGSPRLTSSLTADYSHPIAVRTSMLFGAGYRYKDAVVNQFEHTGQPLPMGPQNIVDLYTGLATEGVRIRLYGTNICNNRSYAGLLYIDDPTKPEFVPVQPRAIGLSVDYQFH
jgi:iron complex outermembrane receptor protein